MTSTNEQEDVSNSNDIYDDTDFYTVIYNGNIDDVDTILKRKCVNVNRTLAETGMPPLSFALKRSKCNRNIIAKL